MSYDLHLYNDKVQKFENDEVQQVINIYGFGNRAKGYRYLSWGDIPAFCNRPEPTGHVWEICISDFVLGLSKYIKQSIILHELGHVNYNHTKSKDANGKYPDEIKAWLFACCKQGTIDYTIQALTEIENHYKNKPIYMIAEIPSQYINPRKKITYPNIKKDIRNKWNMKYTKHIQINI